MIRLVNNHLLLVRSLLLRVKLDYEIERYAKYLTRHEWVFSQPLWWQLSSAPASLQVVSAVNHVFLIQILIDLDFHGLLEAPENDPTILSEERRGDCLLRNLLKVLSGCREYIWITKKHLVLVNVEVRDRSGNREELLKLKSLVLLGCAQDDGSLAIGKGKVAILSCEYDISCKFLSELLDVIEKASFIEHYLWFWWCVFSNFTSFIWLRVEFLNLFYELLVLLDCLWNFINERLSLNEWCFYFLKRKRLVHFGFCKGIFDFDFVDLYNCDHFLFEIFECLLRLSACDVQHWVGLPDFL
jgi:hypothetical protein